MRDKIFLLLFVFAGLLGCWLSYLALEAHFAHFLAPDLSPAICGISEKLNCKAAVESHYAVILGMPIASIGFLFYGLVAFYALLTLVVNLFVPRNLFDVILALSVCACVYSAFLLFVSVTELKSICPICLATYLVNVSLLVLAWFSNNTIKVFDRVKSGFLILIFLPVSFLKSFATPEGRFQSITKCLVVIVGFLFLALSALQAPAVARQMVLKRAVSTDQILPWPKADNKFSETLELNGSPFGDYYIGRLDAPIKLVEFFDYECSACKQFYHTLKELLMAYPDKYLLVYKNFPLDKSCNPAIPVEMHRSACFAANLARCAGEQGHFHEVSSYLMSLPIDESTTVDALRSDMLTAVKTYGLDSQALDECMQSGRHLEIVKRDIEQGVKLNLTGTPSLWINGKKAPPSLSPEILRSIFDDILGAS